MKSTYRVEDYYSRIITYLKKHNVPEWEDVSQEFVMHMTNKQTPEQISSPTDYLRWLKGCLKNFTIDIYRKSNTKTNTFNPSKFSKIVDPSSVDHFCLTSSTSTSQRNFYRHNRQHFEVVEDVPFKIDVYDETSLKTYEDFIVENFDDNIYEFYEPLSIQDKWLFNLAIVSEVNPDDLAIQLDIHRITLRKQIKDLKNKLRVFLGGIEELDDLTENLIEDE